MKLSDAKAQPLETYNFIGVHPVHTIYPEFLYLYNQTLWTDRQIAARQWVIA